MDENIVLDRVTNGNKSECCDFVACNRIKDLPVRAKELGMNAIAITDHGVMFGAKYSSKAVKGRRSRH